MDDIGVTKEGVTQLLKGLNPSKALGPNELHPRVLKELAKELGTVFARLFQQSINTGEIPKEWSLANMCPLFKKGDRSLACNYRPVSLTCIPCELLGHIVCSNIMGHLDQSNLLSDKQYAFRKWHSYETQLTTVINDWAKILDKKGKVDTFILDFEKAFDNPPHELLKSKLFSYGIGGMDKCFSMLQTAKGSGLLLKKQLIKDRCAQSWNMEVLFGILIRLIRLTICFHGVST